jgi:hypothetical protein
MRIVLAALCIFLSGFIFSCGDKQKEGRILNAKEMQYVMWDMLQAEAYTQNFLKKDSTKKELVENAALQKKIFELHKISREDFDNSYTYYNAHPDEMKKILDSVSAQAERSRSKVMMERYGKGKIEAQ